MLDVKRMLARYPVKELQTGTLSRRYAYTVVVMQHYPRFVRKELVDEYLRCLAPDKPLFTEFKTLEREIKDHDLAFQTVSYQQRFWVSDAGREALERLSALATLRPVYLLCQCAALQRCHADLLLLTARRYFQAPIQTVRVKYPEFEQRLEHGFPSAPTLG